MEKRQMRFFFEFSNMLKIVQFHLNYPTKQMNTPPNFFIVPYFQNQIWGFSSRKILKTKIRLKKPQIIQAETSRKLLMRKQAEKILKKF